MLLIPCFVRVVLGQESGVRSSVQGGHAGVEPLKGERGAQSLSNDSIIKLVNAGLVESTIVSIINTQPGKYSTGVDDIKALKKAGVSEKVITAMLNKSASVRPQSQASRYQIHVPAGADGPPKPPPTPNVPGLKFPGPDDPAFPTVPSPTPARQIAQGLVFDDAAYHRCSARDDLMKSMTLGQKAAFNDEKACPFSTEIDRAYHACLEEHLLNDTPLEDDNEYARRKESEERECGENVSEPEYLQSHPVTIAIEKVRKIYLDKPFRGNVKKMITKDTCLEIVDLPSEADALLETGGERMEYDGTESGDINCNRSGCTDGVTIVDESGVHHVVLRTIILVDPHTNRTLERWDEFMASSKDFGKLLGGAVDCGNGK